MKKMNKLKNTNQKPGPFLKAGILLMAALLFTAGCSVKPTTSPIPSEEQSYGSSSMSVSASSSSSPDSTGSSSEESSSAESVASSSAVSSSSASSSSKVSSQASSSSSSSTGSSSSSISEVTDPTDKLLVDGKKIAGGVVSDYIAMNYWGNSAGSNWMEGDLFGMLKNNGMNYVRVGVTTNSVPSMDSTAPADWHTLPWTAATWGSREYAAQILREAQAKGMKKDLFLFLSYTAAHGGQQLCPPEWKGMTVAQTGAKLEQYCYSITKYYMDKGIDIDIYEIGNEIERGILEFRPGERIELPAGVDQLNNTTWMTNNIWNIEAELLKKAIAGIKRANPNAVIGLHIAGVGWTAGEAFTVGFFNAMSKYEVPYDLACLSYYSEPTRSTEAYFKKQIFSDLIEFLGKTKGKKVLISEWAYPNTDTTVPSPHIDGYPLSEEGQRKFTRDFLDFCNNNPYILGTMYFYPEYYKGLFEDSVETRSGLFKDQFTPMPALLEYAK